MSGPNVSIIQSSTVYINFPEESIYIHLFSHRYAKDAPSRGKPREEPSDVEKGQEPLPGW